MAKGLRSNNKKALRTIRRQKIAKDPEWLATAEAHRQEVLERLVTSAKPAVPDQKEAAGMDVDSRQPEAAEAEADADAAGVQHHKTKGGRKVKMVTSPGVIHLTKKKAMKLRKKQAAGNDLWKQTAPMAFHSRKSKRKGVP